LESPLAPIVVFATNRGHCKVRGTDVSEPHGIPRDLLQRVMLIATKPYSMDEVSRILRLRATAEKLKIADDALQALASLGAERSLRYSVQLLSPCATLAQAAGRDTVTQQDVSDAATLFLDARSSARILGQHHEKFLR
ncbi:MAG: hypothetical protein MHM6MM_008676, partial [Cercozoa sp. M6MM]